MAILLNSMTGTVRYSNENINEKNISRFLKKHNRIRSIGKDVVPTPDISTATTTTVNPYLNMTEWTWVDGEVTVNEYTHEQPPRTNYPIYIEEGGIYISGFWSWRENVVIYDDLEATQARWRAIGTVGEYIEYVSDYEREIYDQGYPSYATGHFFSRIII
jgi:hypothetical protein